MITKILLVGSEGKMGQTIKDLISKSKNLKLVASWDKNKKPSAQDIKNADVVIDFSNASNTKAVAQFCAKTKLPLVSGVTGLSKGQMQEIKKASKKTSVVWAPNFGFGIKALRKASQKILETFPTTEVVVEEAHHRHKKDAPSGTAKLIYEEIKTLVDKKTKVPPPISIRGGEVFGIHRVWFFSAGEWLCLEHQATDRKVFARGALKAAQWVSKKKKGLFNFDQVK